MQLLGWTGIKSLLTLHLNGRVGYQNGRIGKIRTVSVCTRVGHAHVVTFFVEILEPDAGIVNFYQEKDTLMAHVDRSEVCATSPLVSIS